MPKAARLSPSPRLWFLCSPPAGRPAEGRAVCLHLPAEEPWRPGDAAADGGVQEPVRPERLPRRPRGTTVWGEDGSKSGSGQNAPNLLDRAVHLILHRPLSWREWNSSVQATTAAAQHTWRRRWSSTCRSSTSARQSAKGSLSFHWTVTSLSS